jgi:hypothetical protein
MQLQLDRSRHAKCSVCTQLKNGTANQEDQLSNIFEIDDGLFALNKASDRNLDRQHLACGSSAGFYFAE